MERTLIVPFMIEENGVIHIGQTRVTLDSVVYAFQDGATPEDIVHQFPSLDLSDVYLVIAYYLKHPAEVDAYLQKRAKVIEEIRQLNESRFDPVGIRDRLLQRQRAFSRQSERE